MKSLQSLFDSIDYNIKRLNNDVQGQLSVFIFSSHGVPLGPKLEDCQRMFEIIQTKPVEARVDSSRCTFYHTKIY